MSLRKELIHAYRERKVPMGVLRIRHTASGKSLYAGGVNLPALENRFRFQLDLGSFPNESLQADWTAFGPAAFVFETVSLLEPREGVDDYRADVEALELLCLEQDQPWEPDGYHPLKR